MLCPQQPNRNKLYNCFHWQGPDLMIYYSGSCDINITAGIPTRPAWKGDYYVNFQSPSIRLDPSIQHRWPAKFLSIAKQYYIFHCHAMACHHSVLETPFCDLSENCATFHRKKRTENNVEGIRSGENSSKFPNRWVVKAQPQTSLRSWFKPPAPKSWSTCSTLVDFG